MASWYFEKGVLGATPSRSAGVDGATEARYRREGVQLILDITHKLNLHPLLSPTHSLSLMRYY